MPSRQVPQPERRQQPVAREITRSPAARYPDRSASYGIKSGNGHEIRSERARMFVNEQSPLRVEERTRDSYRREGRLQG